MSGQSSLEVAQALQRFEKKAVGSNYGMPRNIVTFPERRSIVCTGFEVTNDKVKIWRPGGAGYITTEYCNGFGAHCYYPFADVLTTLNIVKVELDDPPIMKLSGTDGKMTITLTKERCNDETEWECEPLQIGGRYINFGAVMVNGKSDGDLDLIVERNANEDYLWHGIEFAISGDKHIAPYRLIARDGQQYEYDVVRVCGHCAIGMVATELLHSWSHKVWWHIGVKRYCIGEIVRQRPITDMEMFTWRLFIIKPQMEICYVG